MEARNTLRKRTSHDLRFLGMGRGLSRGERDFRALAIALLGAVGGGGSRGLWIHVRSVGWTGLVVGGRPRRLV